MGRWELAALAIAGLVLLPVVSLALVAAQGSEGLWGHLARNVLPVAVRDTAILLTGVGLMVAAIGVTTAWLVSACDFPGRRIFEWALLLPLAVPTYIIAYAYLDLLHPIGPVQTTLRAWLGIASPRDLRLPDIRSMGGCILLLGLVLYPYVYLPVRAVFLMQSGDPLAAARTLGRGPLASFVAVALPLARPAIAAGTALALMEAMNDIGAAEFLGVRTLTVSVYTTWISRSDLPGAAQIALAMLAVVVALVAVERTARRRQRFAVGGRRHPLVPVRLRGWAAAGAVAACSVPVALGFLAPASYLVYEAAERIRFAGVSPRLIGEAINTALFAGMATLVVVVLAVAVTGAARLRPSRLTASASRVASLGYAIPGTVLAIGILPVVTLADRQIAAAAQTFFGASVGLLMLGSGAALVYAYAARFLAIGTGGIEAGLAPVSPSLDHAARTLGRSEAGTLRDVHLPITRPAITAAGLIVFIDCAKELPATLLLRPLNFETLATHLYGEAARGTYEDAAIAALIIVAIGILPVTLLAPLRGRKRPSG
ncbi:iron(III) transport system permease protein [Amaricoccus macauensis]|uniref:Iron(III) transport system permease protein n=1 Tax=Amaricoccus macauensis TaxID=57001 RepID=A0A840SHP0_9RHOB|nr:iron ABC transporter permease [Amaricoccus macauensis]MBB5220454.1 iron(III) transport system permease protein [Amaricoccus macauensis]